MKQNMALSNQRLINTFFVLSCALQPNGVLKRCAAGAQETRRKSKNVVRCLNLSHFLLNAAADFRQKKEQPSAGSAAGRKRMSSLIFRRFCVAPYNECCPYLSGGAGFYGRKTRLLSFADSLLICRQFSKTRLRRGCEIRPANRKRAN